MWIFCKKVPKTAHASETLTLIPGTSEWPFMQGDIDIFQLQPSQMDYYTLTLTLWLQHTSSIPCPLPNLSHINIQSRNRSFSPTCLHQQGFVTLPGCLHLAHVSKPFSIQVSVKMFYMPPLHSLILLLPTCSKKALSNW